MGMPRAEASKVLEHIGDRPIRVVDLRGNALQRHATEDCYVARGVLPNDLIVHVLITNERLKILREQGIGVERHVADQLIAGAMEAVEDALTLLAGWRG